MTTYSEFQLSLLKKRTSKIEERLKKLIQEMATTDNETIGYWSGKQIQLRKEYELLRGLFGTAMYRTIPIEYQQQLRNEVARIKGLKFSGSRSVDFTAFLKSNQHKRSIKNALEESTSAFYIGLDRDYKSLTRLINNTQQTIIKENKINKLIDEGFLEKGLPKDALKKLRNEMIKKSVDGQFITVVDKNGKEIHYNIQDYAELVAYTKIIEAENTAVINTAMEVGSDLVQIDVHNTDCPICAEVEGKVYSITGTDKDFPVMDFVLPLHPRCKHVSTVVFREMLEERGIQKYIDFANGKTDIHPTRKSFIPVSQRTLV